MGLSPELPGPLNLAMLFTLRDRAAAVHLSDRMAVMYLGLLVKLMPDAALLAGPRNPAPGALR